MKRTLIFGVLLIAILVIAGLAYVLRPSPEASAPIAAVPLDAATETPTVTAEAPAPQESTASGSEDTTATDFPPGDELVVYIISQDESEVRFAINELLRNIPTTAVGITDQIAGEVAVNYATPAESQVGVITVNARTLTTDNNNRNRMIRNEILDTGEYEFIVFTPTALSGMPDTVTPGELVSFQVTGDLTIRDITAQVSFNITASVDAAGRLSGTANAVVLRSVYGLTIPSVPSVAEVADEVIVEFDFVAYPK